MDRTPLPIQLTYGRVQCASVRSISIALLTSLLSLFPGAQTRANETLGNFEILHLWRADPEAEAVHVLRTAIEQAGLQWKEHRVDGNFDGVRMMLSQRIAYNVPPSAVFWIGGPDAGNLIHSGVLRPLVGHEDLPILPEIERMTRTASGFVALPLNIHTQNHIVYNRQIFEKLGVGFPATWREFLAIAPKIKASGVAALAVSDQRWQLRFLFLSILAEQLSPDLLTAFLTGQMTQTEEIRAGLIAALQIMGELKNYINDDSSNLDWSKVVEHVRDTRAAALVLGDFVSTAFNDPNLYACGLPPGNKYIIWSLDLLIP